MTECQPPQLPHPADAVTVGEWENTDGSWGTPALPFRTFTGHSWVIPAAHDVSLGWGIDEADIRVQIEGIQFANSSVKRWVAVQTRSPYQNEISLTPASARLLSEALVAAHAEIRRVSQPSGSLPAFSEAI